MYNEEKKKMDEQKAERKRKAVEGLKAHREQHV